MSAIPVIDQRGERCGEILFADDLLVTDRGEQAVHEVLVAYRAARRAGTASTLGKGDVSGSNKKPWKQKGLGRARAGYRQSPVWRGGGVVFGPKPRDYSKIVPRKVAQLAFRRAFSDKVVGQAVRVVEQVALAASKTKLLVGWLKGIKAGDRAVLLVLDAVDGTVARAARNVPRLEIVAARDLNTYQLTRYAAVIMDRAALATVERRLKPAVGRDV